MSAPDEAETVARATTRAGEAGHGEPGRIAPAAAAAVRTAIRLAGGREVCFVCTVDEAGLVVSARVAARGDVSSVLALPGFANRGELLLHNHPSGWLEPSGADLAVAARLHDDGIGFAIVDNDASRVYVVVEIPRARPATTLAPEDIAGLLGPDGPVARRLGRYEDRPSQREMAGLIASLFSRGGVGLIEAGTGVGKSLGYLVPALRWAAESGERTVVSTNTITLQEQLTGKDLPFLAEALTDQKVRFALLKGWRNYLCLQRLEQARAQGPALFDDAASVDLAAIEAWAEKTTDGSLADLPDPPRGEVWDEVAAEGDLCTRLRCPHFERCFVFTARRAAAQADVIVVNHHLLMADLAVRRASQRWDEAAVLPAFKRLVIDEGHHLEDAAASHLGQEVSRRSLERLFNRLDRRGKGLLPALERALSKGTDLLSVASLDLLRARLAPSLHTSRVKAAALCDLLVGWLATRDEPQVRLTDAFADDAIWSDGLGVALDDLLAEIDLLGDGLRMVRERLESDERRAEELAPLLNEVRGVTRRLSGAGDALRAALRPERDGLPRVRWLERRGGEGNIGATAVPLDLAPVLREDLFRRVETAVVTSATLAVGDGFDFLTRRLGLDDPELEPVTATLASPFSYPTQAVLAIPSDFPAPNLDGAAHFARTLSAAEDLIAFAGGGVFLLFTSHRDVREAARVLRERGVAGAHPLLVHGEAPRDDLLRRFRAHGDAVLVGTASFWEGVDIPGRALRGLVLARIPFRVPTEPVTAAQCEAIEAEGRSAFDEYMIPHAALRLKQGFGRLIRTADDRGVVVICDPRVVTKGYGRRLLQGLPPAARLQGPWALLRDGLRAFYSSGTDTPSRG
ncbi:MAG: helicase C-terminal domain-containing protein [Gemmatimonadota bacterium]|nr:helicase C-terminal domain-containing protein [Gemmatimonadota bacterium]MDQ8147779.1 helicase C-terminal domain-containing protein [Gemmatimonadota bacterium]MDQ8149418.1 helicase C-terminal domain-containing protein [Gemmatimonadota bacterium]MDQ8157176.1 helicase C-terminal domain-containing protein [Gemmatimonadota bacterium]MDQ8177100.1 helicase C-terminal domain-containing protein [Gemmatimonadota bacterium]